MARPAFIPTDEQRSQVKAMRANGDPVPAIARSMGIAYSTLRGAFRTELKEGKEDSIGRVGLTLFQAALTDWHAADKWLARRGGPQWQNTERRLLGGIADAPPIPLDVNAKVTIYLPDNGRAKVSLDAAVAGTGTDPAAGADPGGPDAAAIRASNDAC